MSEEADEQIKEMTRMIYRAAGFPEWFVPHNDWNDFHLVCDAMGVDSIQIDRRSDGNWWVAIWSEERHASGADDIDESHPDKQTAAFMALYEFAKWKLEASE